MQLPPDLYYDEYGNIRSKYTDEIVDSPTDSPSLRPYRQNRSVQVPRGPRDPYRQNTGVQVPRGPRDPYRQDMGVIVPRGPRDPYRQNMGVIVPRGPRGPYKQNFVYSDHNEKIQLLGIFFLFLVISGLIVFIIWWNKYRVLEFTCKNDFECKDDEECVDGMCVPGKKSCNPSCPVNLLCDQISGTCKHLQCTNDNTCKNFNGDLLCINQICTTKPITQIVAENVSGTVVGIIVAVSLVITVWLVCLFLIKAREKISQFLKSLAFISFIAALVSFTVHIVLINTQFTETKSTPKPSQVEEYLSQAEKTARENALFAGISFFLMAIGFFLLSYFFGSTDTQRDDIDRIQTREANVKKAMEKKQQEITNFSKKPLSDKDFNLTREQEEEVKEQIKNLKNGEEKKKKKDELTEEFRQENRKKAINALLDELEIARQLHEAGRLESAKMQLEGKLNKEFDKDERVWYNPFSWSQSEYVWYNPFSWSKTSVRDRNLEFDRRIKEYRDQRKVENFELITSEGFLDRFITFFTFSKLRSELQTNADILKKLREETKASFKKFDEDIRSEINKAEQQQQEQPQPQKQEQEQQQEQPQQ